jgi:hypothetical protein
MLSDISQSKCAEKRVAKGVYRYVSVRVRNAAQRALYLYSSQPERKSLSQCVYIVSVSYSDVHIREIISTKINKNP